MNSSESKALLDRIELLNSIGSALSAQQELNPLLEMILSGARQLTNSDGGSLYLLKDKLLVFELVHNTSLDIHMGGTSDEPVNYPEIPLYDEEGEPQLSMVVTRAVIEDQIINVPDAYQNTDYDFSGTKTFDMRNNYQSRSLLAVPLKDHENKIIGVLQLINSLDQATGAPVPYTPSDESLVASLASQAAIALTRKRLIDGLHELLQALVKLIAESIDEKSPHTGEHCRRVPEITMAIAESINKDSSPAFGDTYFDKNKMHELEMAAWLHDCGKLTTPDHIIDKKTKLQTPFDRMQLVEAKLDILKREAEIISLKQQAGKGTDPGIEKTSLDAISQEIEEAREFLKVCNTGSEFLDPDKIEKIKSLSSLKGPMGDKSLVSSLLSEDEVYNLSTSRGTLNEEERQMINNHAQVSINMLSTLPFPEHLQQVPVIAGGHHERMDGKGYPAGVPAGELPLQARILAVADIFEALTSSERAYRSPNKLSEALTIMARMCKGGHIDAELFENFVVNKAYHGYAQQRMKSEQYDEVNTEEILKIFTD